MPIRLTLPSPALTVALLALFVALGGPAEAAKLINGKKIRKGTVSSKQVKNRSLMTRDLRKGTVRRLQQTPSRSVGTAELADAAVGPAQLQVGAVTAAALAPNSVTGASVADATIGAAELADGGVNSAKLANGEVRKVDIAAGAVGTSEIQANSVTGGEVRDGMLSAGDLGAFSGVADLTFGPFPTPTTGRCDTELIERQPSVPGASLLDDIVLVGQPADWPDAVTLDARPVTQTTVGVRACVLGDKPEAVGPFTRKVAFVAIQP